MADKSARLSDPPIDFLARELPDGRHALAVRHEGAEAVVEVVLSLDTSAYADGDVLAETQEVAGAVTQAGAAAVLDSVVLVDEDDQGKTLDLLFFATNVSLGTENAAPSISDANARQCLGAVRINSSDYLDLGGVRVATVRGVGLLLQAAPDATSVFVAAVIREAGTYTASGLRAKLGLIR